MQKLWKRKELVGSGSATEDGGGGEAVGLEH